MELVVALDLPTKEKNIELVESIKKYDIWLKVGLRTYIRDGKEFLVALKKINPNFKIFLDLKLYDIPNTMADAEEEITDLGVDMFNIHASAGKEAMEAVMKRLEKYEIPPLVLAVTALTSFSDLSFENVYNANLTKTATKFAKDAFVAGLDGVVCSVFESLAIKNSTEDSFLTITPGIRPFGENAGDQKRIADIKKAKEEFSNFIVIGRPIYQADDPVQVVAAILDEIKK
jgi:orotidine-5'-phosphate decarboxylase